MVYHVLSISDTGRLYWHWTNGNGKSLRIRAAGLDIAMRDLVTDMVGYVLQPGPQTLVVGEPAA